MLQYPTLQYKQKGFVVVLLLLILTLGISSYLLSEVQFSDLEAEREEKTTQALAQAKKALIAKMLARVDGSTPSEIGTLACPDTSNDGVSNNNLCSGNQIGRLPFQTLDIPEIRDGYNERLWYAYPQILDSNNGTAIRTNTNELLNSGGNLFTLDGQPVLAVIMSAGKRLSNPDQSNRPSNTVSDYLEDDNSDGDTSFTTGNGVNNFNDTVIAITSNDILEEIHRRVIANVKDYLEDFYNTLGYYPYPEDADFDCQNDTSAGLLAGVNIGRLPLTFNNLPGTECTYPETETAPGLNNGTDNLTPGILTDNIISINAWRNDIWYAVSSDCTADVPIAAMNCDNTPAANYLTLDGNNVKYIIFIAGQTPTLLLAGNLCNGLANNAQVVPPATFCDSLEDYDVAIQNTDGDNQFFSNNFMNVPPIAPNIDRNDVIYGEPSL